MKRTSRSVAVVLAAVYVAFWVWYGGNGNPLRPAEVDQLTQQMAAAAKARGAEPDLRLIDAFRTLARQDDGREFYMVNLMRYREQALYPEGSGYDDDVEAAAARYNEAVLPALIRRGSLPILLGRWQGAFLQPEGAEVWDQLAIVRYRSRRDMLEMAVALGRENAVIHKWASIEQTQVFPIEPIFDLVFVRGAVAVLLLAFGVAVHAALRLASARGKP